jgi:vacuolar-type H+-ATPase subunit I/STV1
MSETRSDQKKIKELKVLELHDQGLPYSKIASMIHLSLRDVTKFVSLASNKIKSPSVTSIHDEIILEYRVNLLRSEVKELETQRKNQKDELDNLRAKKYDLLNQLLAKQSELDAVKRESESEKFSKLLNGIFSEEQFT